MDGKTAAESLGLRDYKSDPELLEKAKTERDLVLNFSISEGLCAHSALKLFSAFLLQPDAVKETLGFELQHPEILIDVCTDLSNKVMTEIYKKQRELFKDKDH